MAVGMVTRFVHLRTLGEDLETIECTIEFVRVASVGVGIGVLPERPSCPITDDWPRRRAPSCKPERAGL